MVRCKSEIALNVGLPLLSIALRTVALSSKGIPTASMKANTTSNFSLDKGFAKFSAIALMFNVLTLSAPTVIYLPAGATAK